MDNDIKKVIEAILFVSERPMSLEDIKDVIEGADMQVLRQGIEELKNEYVQQGRSFEILEIAGGYQIITKPEFGAWIKKLYKARFTEKLSGPAMETLAIIAYKQPLTRAEIEAIRGVNVDGVIKTLLEREVIKIVGRKDVLGRPILYGTTKKFLEYFGLSSLDALPSLKEFTEQDLTDEQIAKRMKSVYQKDIPNVEEMSKETAENIEEGLNQIKKPETEQEVENGPAQEPAQEG